MADRRRGRGGKKESMPDPFPEMEVDHPATVDFRVDGSYKEGGGQILRNSFALASILGKTVTVEKIRANRPKPGLQAQHLSGLVLVNRMHQGKLVGGRLNSSVVSYTPTLFLPGDHVYDIGTAGSIGLIFQVSMPPMVFGSAPSSVKVSGGTNVSHSPSVEYIRDIFLPFVNRMGVNARIQLTRRGFYPKGQGSAELHVEPVRELKPIQVMDRGQLTELTVNAFRSKLPDHVTQRALAAAVECIKEEKIQRGLEDKFVTGEVDVTRESFGETCWVEITAKTSTGCVFRATGLGERGKAAEEVGKEAAAQFIKDWSEGGCFDEYMQDQLLIFMALANGNSQIWVGKLSMHTETSIHMCGMLTGAKFTVTPHPSGNGNIIECQGIAFVNKSLDSAATSS